MLIRTVYSYRKEIPREVQVTFPINAGIQLLIVCPCFVGCVDLPPGWEYCPTEDSYASFELPVCSTHRLNVAQSESVIFT